MSLQRKKKAHGAMLGRTPTPFFLDLIHHCAAVKLPCPSFMLTEGKSLNLSHRFLKKNVNLHLKFCLFTFLPNILVRLCVIARFCIPQNRFILKSNFFQITKWPDSPEHLLLMRP